MMLFSFAVSKADVAMYRAHYFAYKYVNDYGRWTSWSNWEDSDIRISLDLDKEKIVIYTEITQVYYILTYNGEYQDNKGGLQAEFKVVDQDGDYGIIRLRRQNDGTTQLYVEFSNIMWVYSGLRAM